MTAAAPVRIHVPTVDVVRAQLDAVRADLALIGDASLDRTERRAAAIADDVVATIDAWLKAISTPPCAACSANAETREAAQ